MTNEVVGGPWVQAALFCERVLIEHDNVPSMIRVIDQIRHPIVASGPGVVAPTLPYQLNGFIALKPGAAKGRFDYAIVMETPAGLKRQVANGSFTFAGGPHNGVNIPFQLAIVFDQEGLYWFDIVLDGDRVLTRMPFYVEYVVMRPGVAGD
ncbi:MAG: hypothetical protein EPO22_05350 [Dehalococcoidia bacterium]|nr:MAG: hypothetical protein EPO22_05350 [Dehalococcoidia bacterium]